MESYLIDPEPYQSAWPMVKLVFWTLLTVWYGIWLLKRRKAVSGD